MRMSENGFYVEKYNKCDLRPARLRRGHLQGLFCSPWLRRFGGAR